MSRILLVEDDANLASGMQYNLERAGYEVTVAADGEEGLRSILNRTPDLVLLDLMLPRRSGFAVLEEMSRKRVAVPVIILSARDQEVDKLRGFDLGAVDYVTKPFSLGELLARVRLRLSEHQGSSRFALADRQVDLDRFVVRHGERETRLTQTEVALLRKLYQERDQAVTREALLQSIWNLGARSTRTLDTHMARLRKKIESNPATPRHLLTIHGVGYRLSLEAKEA